MDQVFQTMFAPIHEIAVVDVLQDESGCERADNGRQADDAGKPGEKKAEHEPVASSTSRARTFDATKKSRLVDARSVSVEK